jgi:hypothetical protein
MMPTSRFHLPQDLPPTTALALFDLLSDLTDALWQQYQTELVELIMDDLNAFPATQQTFDFNDDLPF